MLYKEKMYMRVRQLTVYELKEASKILNEAYSKDVFPDMQYEEEIALLRSQMTEESLWIEKSKRKITIWGALENDKIQGVGVIDKNGTIIFEAVKPEFRGKGIGKELTRTMKESVGIFEYSKGRSNSEVSNTEHNTNADVSKTECNTNQKVSNTEYNTKPYFNRTETVKSDKINDVFNNMPRPKLQPATIQNEEKPIRGIKLSTQGIIFLVVFIIIMVISFVNMANNLIVDNTYPEINNVNPLDNISWIYDDDELEVEVLDEDETMYEIFNSYIADDLGYDVDYEEILIDESDDNQTSYFYISYPKISFNDGRNAEKINEILASAARMHYDMMYPELSESLAGSNFIDEKYPYFKSIVDYEVTYMSDDLICVVYTDEYFLGSIYAEYSDLRVRLINLNTAEEYAIEDILNCDSDFAQYYYDRLVDENDDFEQATLLTPDLLYNTLHGEIPEGRYYNNVIIDAEGIYIGFTYHYGDGNLIMRGWDYTFIDDETVINDCKINDDFWDMIKY